MRHDLPARDLARLSDISLQHLRITFVVTSHFMTGL
jgi:hypothetical protein